MLVPCKRQIVDHLFQFVKDSRVASIGHVQFICCPIGCRIRGIARVVPLKATIADRQAVHFRHIPNNALFQPHRVIALCGIARLENNHNVSVGETGKQSIKDILASPV